MMVFAGSLNRRGRAAGFTLIELAIVLGIVGVLAAGLYRLLSTSSQQTKDLNTAQQQQSLINAVAGFLADTSTTTNPGGQAWLTSLGVAGAVATLPLPATNAGLADCQAKMAATPQFIDFCNFLPSGFSQLTTNPYGQKYAIQVRLDSVVVTGGVPTTTPQTYSFMIEAFGPTIPDTDGGRIASLIGGDGGFIYSAAVCTPGALNYQACGTLGAWSIDVRTYGLPTGFGSVASRTYVPAGVTGNNFWLARQAMNGDAGNFYSYNTMHTPLFMNPGFDLYMYPDDNTASPPLPASFSGSNNIHLANGALIVEGATPNPAVAGSIQLNAGSLTFGGSGTNEIEGGGPTSMGRIIMVAPTPQTGGPPNYADSFIQLSTGINANGRACTFLNSNAAADGCPTTTSIIAGVPQAVAIPAINILAGDINISNGLVEALKILSASDVRLKTHIRPIENPLASLMKVDAVAFALKDGGSESMGVTAQNLEKTYPQLVSDVGGRKYVDYNGLIGPLIGAIQELKKQNDDLRSELQAQKVREDKMESALNKKIGTP